MKDSIEDVFIEILDWITNAILTILVLLAIFLYWLFNIKTDEEKAIQAFYKAVEDMLNEGPEKDSLRYKEMEEAIDKCGEILYKQFEYSNLEIQKMLQDITVEWGEKHFGDIEEFEEVKNEYLQINSLK